MSGEKSTKENKDKEKQRDIFILNMPGLRGLPSLIGGSFISLLELNSGQLWLPFVFLGKFCYPVIIQHRSSYALDSLQPGTSPTYFAEVNRWGSATTATGSSRSHLRGSHHEACTGDSEGHCHHRSKAVEASSLLVIAPSGCCLIVLPTPKTSSLGC